MEICLEPRRQGWKNGSADFLFEAAAGEGERSRGGHDEQPGQEK